jgi:NB-ARC domain
METDRRWLLIFDNVESWEAISPYLPYPIGRTTGSVIITTQSHDLAGLPQGSRRLKLEPFDEDAGSEMLLGYLRKDRKTDPEKDLAREISTFVGGLPVAIAHVAGYADYSHYSLDELLETFREWRRRTGVATDEADDLPMAFRKAAFSYDQTLSMVWNVTLRELSRDAQDVMYILAYLNCEAVPESMLWGRMHEEPSLHFLDPREKLR